MPAPQRHAGRLRTKLRQPAGANPGPRTTAKHAPGRRMELASPAMLAWCLLYS